jgi:uncharacterized protein (DUF305 family)
MRVAGRRLRAIAVGVLATLLLVASLVILRLHVTSPSAATAPGPIDIGFASSMLLHHEQAIMMSQLLLMSPEPSSVSGLARSIADAQLVEAGEMRGWLRLWGQPLRPSAPNMGWMLLGERPPDADLNQYLLDCRSSATGMAGLASMGELNRLRELKGPARDIHFLTLMRAHHRGGLPMLRFAAREARLPAVRELARQMAAEQAEELGRIDLVLMALVSRLPGGNAAPNP